MPAARVVSLIASATEIVAALGALGRLVGRSHECDFPPAIAGLPALTAPKLDVSRPSGAIDREVRQLLEAALSIYRVDAGRLRELRPDLVITQTQCEVCAVSLADVERALAEWTGTRPQVVALAPNALADVFADIGRVAAALEIEDRGSALIAEMKRRMAATETACAALDKRPRVAALEWIEPLMAGGNWMPELIGMAGGANLFGAAGRHSPALDFDALLGADPDIVLVLPCGFDVARTTAELPALTRRPGWNSLRAARAGQVYVLDGNRYFNRPGPRLVESLEILAEILHPERFAFGHEGDGWVRWRGEAGNG